MGIKKNASDIIPACVVECYVGEKVITKKEMFAGVISTIQSLGIDKTLTIKYKEEYNLSFDEFRRKITNIVFGHARKHIEKKFETLKIDSETITITRHKDKTF